MLFRNTNHVTDQLNKFQLSQWSPLQISRSSVMRRGSTCRYGWIDTIYESRAVKIIMSHLNMKGTVSKVFATMSWENLYGPFFCIQSTMKRIVYLNMLREWLIPQLQEDIPDIPTTLH
jgi:hypothetical protein